MDYTSQLSAVRALVSSFPQGAVRAAVTEACDRAEDTVALRVTIPPGEALVLAIHFIVQSEGYDCAGLEGGAANVLASPIAAVPSAPPPGWKANTGVYAIEYTHRSERGRRIVLRGVEMGDTLALNVAVVGSAPEESYSVDVRAADYVSAAPAVPASRALAYAATIESLCPTTPRAALSELLNRTLLAPIDAAAEARRAAQRVAQREAELEAVRVERARAEYAQRQRQHQQQHMFGQRDGGRGGLRLGGGTASAGYGRADLDPHFGGLMGGMMSGQGVDSGMGGGMGAGGLASGGGMLMGPGSFQGMGRGGGFGGGGALPPGVPHGARYDPIGPGNSLPLGSDRRGGRPPFSGPTPDHLRPPGADDEPPPGMYY
jgi:hypothetical protein